MQNKLLTKILPIYWYKMWLFNLLSTIVVQGFVYYSNALYFCRHLYNTYFRRSTKLMLPSDPVYFSRCWLEQELYDTYQLCVETGNISIQQSNTAANTLYLYHDADKDITFCNRNAIDHCRHPQKSKARFINIVYSNPDSNKEPLTLRLDHSYLIEGNEILGATHVYYLLKSQYESTDYTFNLNYELKIMDGNFAITVLNADKYLCLTAGNKGFCVNDIKQIY